jgi:uncharacterized protein YtpQ (UPF0354 family)
LDKVNKYDPSIIFPRLYAALPSVGRADVSLSAADSPVEKPLAGDVIIFYGRDVGTHYELISNKELAHYNLTRDQLHEVAVENLSNTEKEIRLHQAEGIHFLRCNGDLEASLLLHAGIWDFVQDQIGGDVLASVPARNVLLISGTKKEQVSELKNKTCAALEHEPRPISLKLFLRAERTWKEYEV